MRCDDAQQQQPLGAAGTPSGSSVSSSASAVASKLGSSIKSSTSAKPSSATLELAKWQRNFDLNAKTDPVTGDKWVESCISAVEQCWSTSSTKKLAPSLSPSLSGRADVLYFFRYLRRYLAKPPSARPGTWTRMHSSILSLPEGIPTRSREINMLSCSKLRISTNGGECHGTTLPSLRQS